jgi:hypothetical protein
MGDIADQLIDQMICGNSRTYPPKKRKNFQSGSGNFHWRQADGRAVSMRDMSIDHLRNALKLCGRTNNNGKAQQLRQVIFEEGYPL